MHLIRYKPMGLDTPDYFIAYQCGFVIRLFQTPPDGRFDFGPSEDGHKQIAEIMADRSLAPEVRQMGEYLLSGLLTQLRSVPIGLRVDNWLIQNYPELCELQRRGIETQLEQNNQVFAMGASKIYPSRIYKPNVAMNAAFALFWARTWTDEKLSLPYKATGLLEKGRALLGIFDKVPSDPSEDRRLVDEWAYEIGLKGWYQWSPYTLND